MTQQQQRIFDEIADLVRHFEGREYSGPLDRDTRFFGHLGFASIDAVVMGEKLEERFGQPLPYGQFIAELGRQGADDVTLGQLVDFVGQHVRLSQP